MLEHGGRIKAAAMRYGIPEREWLDLSTGINPCCIPLPVVPDAIWQQLPQEDDDLDEAARRFYGTNELLCVAGSQAAIQALPKLFKPGSVAMTAISYAEHAHNWQRHGHEVRRILGDEILQSDADVVVIVNPNNPTGRLFTAVQLLKLHAVLAARGACLVVDEAFMDATPEHSLAAFCPRENLIVLRSLGKFFGLAGARVGFVLAQNSILQMLRDLLGPWPIAAPSRCVAIHALNNASWQQHTRQSLHNASLRLAELLRRHDLAPLGGTCLFQWVCIENAQTLHEHLARMGILTRLFDDPSSLRFGLPRDEQDWARLEAALGGSGRISSQVVDSITVMVQGTTSDAGKSTLVAALCRYLVRQGIKVAPFKPQNMALNSAVTMDGGEIGRAQAVQAQAARIAPHTDMNPVLLKPNSDTGAQVIIHGHAIGNMEALEYHAYKSTARAAVLESHQRLAEQYEIVVVEGAGSPAEINLRCGDIANMGFAETVDCPVILIADIDRGGVFAHLVGTLELLSQSEQNRVAGFVINRFRGDIALLQPGLDWLEQRTNKPVIGVLPYLHGLHLEAEDAVPRNTIAALDGRFRVIVPVLPHISNHTDFDPLRLHLQIEFIYVSMGDAIPCADLIILPGSKSVCRDIESLRRAGWTDAIERHLRYGGKLIGICGGLQMLGMFIHDPFGLEGEAQSCAGLGLLDLSTTLEREKRLHNVSGNLTLEGAPVTGYEIHAGISTGAALAHPAMMLERGGESFPDGAISQDGQIFASYVHGLFESKAASDALLRWAGLRSVSAPDYQARTEADLDRLADAVEQHLDGTMLRRIFALGEDT